MGKSKSFKLTEKLLETYPERIDSALRDFTINAAKDLLEGLRLILPDVDQYKQYQDVLGIFEVIDAQEEGAVAGVFAHKGAHLKVIDSSVTVLYIQPRSIGGEYSDAALVLRAYEPWTVSTLPYEPNEQEAEIIARFVSKREVSAVEMRLSPQLPEIRKKLSAVGVVNFRGAGDVVLRKVTHDLAFFALRTEFGLQGYPHIPHWRPSVKKIVADPMRLIDERIEDTLTEPRYFGWEDPTFVESVSASEAKETEEFQDRIMV